MCNEEYDSPKRTRPLQTADKKKARDRIKVVDVETGGEPTGDGVGSPARKAQAEGLELL